MLVDEDGFQELADLHAEMYDRTLDIQAQQRRTADQLRRGGHPDVSTTMFFETPDAPRADESDPSAAPSRRHRTFIRL